MVFEDLTLISLTYFHYSRFLGIVNKKNENIYNFMKNLVIVFGGRSVEHDVSILTGLHAAKNVCDGVSVYLVYLDRDNKFWLAKNLNRLCHRSCWFADGRLCYGKRQVKVDVVLNCCHGGIGEAGELAAMMKVVDIPITSSETESALKMMSKSTTRKILGDSDTNTIDCICMCDIPQDIVDMRDKLPLIIKPDSLGSSIGISVAKNLEELKNAIDLAFMFDKKIVIEKFLEGAIEINCAAFKYGDEIVVSECELVEKDEILGFSDKYLGESPQFVKKQSQSKPNTKDEHLFDRIKGLVRQAYYLFDASGIVRCDFLVVGDSIYLNEINSVPGFLSYHLFMRSGIPYSVLIDMVCRQAILDFEKDNSLLTDFQSNIIQVNRALVD